MADQDATEADTEDPGARGMLIQTVSNADDEGVLSDGIVLGEGTSIGPVPADEASTNTGQRPSAFGRVIIIEPIGSAEICHRFVSKSLSLARLLQNSIFHRAKIINIRTNFNKCRISIQIEKEEMIPQLLEVTDLGQFTVKCYQPQAHSEIKGVISGIGLETDMTELMDSINEQNNSKVALAIRLNKGKEKTPSYSVKLIFSNCTKKLPEYIYIYSQRFKVKDYKEPLLQCFKCQNYGHSSRNCGGKERCVICAGNHNYKDCPKDKIQCANCKGEHTSSYLGCEKAIEAKQINEIRIDKQLTYREAAQQFKAKKVHQIPIPNSQTVANKPMEKKSFSDASSQTEEPTECSPNEKMCAFILECITRLIPQIKTPMVEKENLISDIAREHYGKEIDKTKISYFLKEPKNSLASAIRVTDSDIAESSNSSTESTSVKKTPKNVRKKRKKQTKQ